MVSLIMIAKNEEGGLRRAVNSVKGLVGEVVIGVDKNSTDKTLEIAKEIADVCYEFEWNDSFADARNTYLGKATGEWVIYIDGHEYVKNYQDVDWKEAGKKGDGIRVCIQMEDGATLEADRIFKNGIKFQSKVHNYPEIKKVITDIDFLIIHDRSVQTGEVLKIREEQRDKMIMENLEKGKDPRSLYYTGRQHLDMGRFKKAIKIYEKYLKVVKNEKMIKGRIAEGRKVRFALTKAYYQNKEVEKAIENLDEDLKEYDFIKGQIYSKEGRDAEAIKVLLESHIKKPTGRGFFPVEDIEFQTWDLLSVSLFHMKQYEMAYTATQKALELKDNKQVRSNAKVFAHHFRAVKEKGADYYDRLYKDGYDTTRYKDIYEIVMRMLEEIKSPSILEIGCGVGALGKLIIDKGYKYRGFDISEEGIRQCKELVRRGNFYVGDAYDKKEYRGDYNVAITTETLEHVDDLKVLANVKSGVTFIASVPTFGDVAHLRTYVDKEKDIVNRFDKYLAIERTLFSQDLGIYVMRGTIK